MTSCAKTAHLPTVPSSVLRAKNLPLKLSTFLIAVLLGQQIKFKKITLRKFELICSDQLCSETMGSSSLGKRKIVQNNLRLLYFVSIPTFIIIIVNYAPI